MKTVDNSFGLNFDILSKIFIDNLSAQDLAILKFGMIPKTAFDIFMSCLLTRIGGEYVKNHKMFEGMDPKWVGECLKEEVKRDLRQLVIRAIYRNAKMEV